MFEELHELVGKIAKTPPQPLTPSETMTAISAAQRLGELVLQRGTIDIRAINIVEPLRKFVLTSVSR